jgi:hypothetical protein
MWFIVSHIPIPSSDIGIRLTINPMIKNWNMTDNESHSQIVSLSVIFQYLFMGFIVSHIPVFDHVFHCQSYSSIWSCDSLSVIFQYLIMGFIVSDESHPQILEYDLQWIPWSNTGIWLTMNPMIKYWNMTDNESHDQILEYDLLPVFDHGIHCQWYSSIWSWDSLSVIFQYLFVEFIVSHIPVFDHGIHCKSYSRDQILEYD